MTKTTSSARSTDSIRLFVPAYRERESHPFTSPICVTYPALKSGLWLATNVFNMSPARYLKLRLLNNIHKTLLTLKRAVSR